MNSLPMVKLGEICEKITDGTHHSPPNTARGEFKYITAKNIKSSGLDLSDVTYIDAATHRAIYSRCDVKRNDVLYVKDGATTGRVALNHLDEEFSLLSSVGVLRPGPAIRAKYLFYVLQEDGVRERMLGNVAGVAITRLTLRKLSESQIPIASLGYQDRVVAKLEELLSDLDSGVAELRTAQRKLVKYRQSLVKAAVEGALTAEWRKHNKPKGTSAQLLERILNERRARWAENQLAKFKKQGKLPPKDWREKYPEPAKPDGTALPHLPMGWVWAVVDQLSPDDLANGRSVQSAEAGARVLRLTSVKNGRIDLSEYKCGDWTEEEARDFAVTEGDLLIIRGNGSLSLVGRAGLVGDVAEQVAYPDTLIRLRVLTSMVQAKWVSLVWDGHVVRRHLEQRARTSAGIYKISQPDIISAFVPVPPMREQEEVVQLVERQLETIQTTQLVMNALQKQSAAQRKNILKAAFSGQLVPQDPNDEPASILLERIRTERLNNTPPAANRTQRRA